MRTGGGVNEMKGSIMAAYTETYKKLRKVRKKLGRVRKSYEKLRKFIHCLCSSLAVFVFFSLELGRVRNEL